MHDAVGLVAPTLGALRGCNIFEPGRNHHGRQARARASNNHAIESQPQVHSTALCPPSTNPRCPALPFNPRPLNRGGAHPPFRKIPQVPAVCVCKELAQANATGSASCTHMHMTIRQSRGGFSSLLPHTGTRPLPRLTPRDILIGYLRCRSACGRVSHNSGITAWTDSSSSIRICMVAGDRLAISPVRLQPAPCQSDVASSSSSCALAARHLLHPAGAPSDLIPM